MDYVYCPQKPNTSLTSTLILKSIMLFIAKHCSLFEYFFAVIILRIGLSSGEKCFRVSGQPGANSETFSASSLDLAPCVWYVSHQIVSVFSHEVESVLNLVLSYKFQGIMM